MLPAMRSALVSGGNRGIGLEVVKLILEGSRECRVFLGCRDLASGQALAQKFSATYGSRVEAVQLDVTRQESIDACGVACAKALGDAPLDVLVNNAGILLEGDGKPFSMEAARDTMRVNFEGLVALTQHFMPMLIRSPCGIILSTSSGVGARTLGLLSEADRFALTDASLDVRRLSGVLSRLVDDLHRPDNPYHAIPTVAYGLSKLGVNCYTQVLARQYTMMCINACSPGFCNTGMCADYTGTRTPKSPILGASVFRQVLFTELGFGRTGVFFKENSKAGTPVDEAVSVVDPWIALPQGEPSMTPPAVKLTAAPMSAAAIPTALAMA